MTRLLRHRFKLLLLSLAGSILIGPLILDAIAHAAPGAARTVVFGLAITLLFAGALAVRGERDSRSYFTVLFVVSVLLETAATYLWPGQIDIWDHGLRILFLAFLSANILRHVFRPDVVNFDSLCASLCVYLIVGLIWMNIYVILETFTPGAIEVPRDPNRPITDSPTELEHSINMLYFSFTTLTSVGYGDVVPRSNLARMLAVTEALVGQGYLLVMVSRLVGLHVAQAFPSGTECAFSTRTDAKDLPEKPAQSNELR